ncbi:MAG TPA: hypothetical protein VF610_13285 [Segetibacter sp.]
MLYLISGFYEAKALPSSKSFFKKTLLFTHPISIVSCIYFTAEVMAVQIEYIVHPAYLVTDLQKIK